jgi:hypothetical protein
LAAKVQQLSKKHQINIGYFCISSWRIKDFFLSLQTKLKDFRQRAGQLTSRSSYLAIQMLNAVPAMSIAIIDNVVNITMPPIF